MAARFVVRFDTGELLDGIPFFEPDQDVKGHVEVEVDLPVECRSLAVRLIWHTEGRGDEDKEIVAETDIYRGRLTPGSPIQGTFRFRMPPTPWSFAGKYISIIWAIEVHVNVRFRRDMSYRERLVMRPSIAR